MGQRAAGHKFMPNKFVFPGGKVDAGDHRLQPPYDLHPAVMARLSRGSSEKPGAGAGHGRYPRDL